MTYKDNDYNNIREKFDIEKMEVKNGNNENYKRKSHLYYIFPLLF